MKKFLLGLLACLPLSVLAAPTVDVTVTPAAGISPASVTVSWTTTEVGNCTASGGWTGAKATSGSQVITNVRTSQTYTLTCQALTGSLRVAWTQPTLNTDGSPLTNLASYRIRHAATSAGLTAAPPITIPAFSGTTPVLTYDITGLSAGTRFANITAVSSTGVESDVTGPISGPVVIASASDSASVSIDTKPNPPTDFRVVDQVAMLYQKDRLRWQVGLATIGAPCGRQLQESWRAVNRKHVRLTRAVPKGATIAAQCA